MLKLSMCMVMVCRFLFCFAIIVMIIMIMIMIVILRVIVIVRFILYLTGNRLEIVCLCYEIAQRLYHLRGWGVNKVHGDPIIIIIITNHFYYYYYYHYYTTIITCILITYNRGPWGFLGSPVMGPLIISLYIIS